MLLECENLCGCLSGGSVRKQQAKRELTEGKIKGHNDLILDLADDGIHFDPGRKLVCLNVEQEIVIGSALVQCFRNSMGF